MKRLEGRGAIVVSHWLVGLETVDEILVLEDGIITERDNHQALIDHDAWYARQWRLNAARLNWRHWHEANPDSILQSFHSPIDCWRIKSVNSAGAHHWHEN